MSKERTYLEVKNLKEMLNLTKDLYGKKPAFKLKDANGKYREITHKTVREEIDKLGTALLTLGLKGKRVAIIGENRYEWEIAYLSVVCGVGVVVPLDKSLPENELKRVIERSGVEAIIFSNKYEEVLRKIVLEGIGKLKHLISMDSKTHGNGIYSLSELIEIGEVLLNNGNREYIDAEIDPNEMQIMLFTSGTTSESKVVALCHRNLCENLMALDKVEDVDSNDRFLSFLPIHHVFECTVGFLFSLYKGARTSFCDGIKHMQENYKEYDITFAACVPAIFESMYRGIWKKLEKEGYQFEGAEGSLELMIMKKLGYYKPQFELEQFKVISIAPTTSKTASAMIKIGVDGNYEITAAEGDGPVNALDKALRKALYRFYPELKDTRLIDFKVRVLDGMKGTAALTRVLIESTDGKTNWNTLGVSEDIIEASWDGLVDSIEYYLLDKKIKSERE